MKRLIFLFAICVSVIPAPALQAQGAGNIDWEELWVIPHPTSTNGPYGWMYGDRNYTGLAYDKWNDVVYVVNPGMCTVGGVTTFCPKIHILDAMTGTYATNVGRASAGIIGLTAGQGGQLPLSLDTIVTDTGWGSSWGYGYGGLEQGRFSVYKVDLDDEGRIYAGNLVSPLFSICYPGPRPNCQPGLERQGPYRVYRWDAPGSAPKRVYATRDRLGGLCNPDSGYLSEMTWTRWGDAFEVIGNHGEDSAIIDSTHIFVSGGSFDGQTETNREFVVLVGENRAGMQLSNGLGSYLEFKVGGRFITSFEGGASHGLAATGPTPNDSMWIDGNLQPVRLCRLGYGAGTPPGTSGALLRALSDDETTGTGLSGPIAFIPALWYGKSLLVCADGLPSNRNDTTQPNTRTQARVMNVTTPGQEFREPGLGNTPPLGNRILASNRGTNNYIADVDYKLVYHPDSDKYDLYLFVLMSNNGIAAYRARNFMPVTLVGFRALLNDEDVRLSWDVASEVNNLGFGIERSFSSGREWETICFVAGRGSDPTPFRYGYADPVTATHRSVGSARYRLRQMDTDGAYHYSPEVQVFLGAAPDGIALAQNFPNPVSAAGDGATSIGYQLAKPGFVTMRVFNVLGEEVAVPLRERREAGSWQARIDISRLPAGSYVYELDVDGVTARKTMIVVK